MLVLSPSLLFSALFSLPSFGFTSSTNVIVGSDGAIRSALTTTTSEKSEIFPALSCALVVYLYSPSPSSGSSNFQPP